MMFENEEEEEEEEGKAKVEDDLPIIGGLLVIAGEVDLELVRTW